MVYPYEYYKGEKSGKTSEETTEELSNGWFSLYSQWVTWRIASGFMGLFFFAAAAVQHNDPDPYLWMPVYMVPCVISLAVAFGLTLKAYKPLPSDGGNSSRSSRSVSPTSKTSKSKKASSPVQSSAQTSPGSCSESEKCHGHGMESNVIIPKYGSANEKLDLLITCHVVFCFALGLWTMSVHLAGFRTGLESRQMLLSGKNPSLMVVTSSTEEAKELMGLCLVIAWLSLLRKNNYVLLGRLGLTLGIGMTLLPILAWVMIEIFEGEDHVC